MTTKKPESTKAKVPLERGRYARILADGYTLEVTDSDRAVPDTTHKKTRPSAPKP